MGAAGRRLGLTRGGANRWAGLGDDAFAALTALTALTRAGFLAARRFVGLARSAFFLPRFLPFAMRGR